MHPLVEGDSDEMGEVIMWTYGFWSHRLQKDFNDAALHKKVNESLIWYYCRDNYDTIIDPFGARGNEPKMTTAQKALMVSVILVNHGKVGFAY